MMILSCPNCATKYNLDPEKLGDEGRSVRCTECSYEWFQTADEDEFFDGHVEDIPDEDNNLEEEEVKAEESDVEIDLVATSEPELDTEVKTPTENTKKPVNENNSAPTGRAAAVLLFLCVLSSLWFFKSKIINFWPQSYVVYSYLGQNKDVIDINDISFERFEVAQNKDLLVIKGYIYNLKRDAVQLPPLILTIKGENGQIIKKTIIELENPIIAQEGTLEFDQNIKIDTADVAKVIELRPTTPLEQHDAIKENHSSVSSAG